jgi:serine/threonine protein kinase
MPKEIPKEAQDLISKMLVVDPEKRITVRFPSTSFLLLCLLLTLAPSHWADSVVLPTSPSCRVDARHPPPPVLQRPR